MEEGAQLTLDAGTIGGVQPFPPGAVEQEREHMRQFRRGKLAHGLQANRYAIDAVVDQIEQRRPSSGAAVTGNARKRCSNAIWATCSASR